MNEPSRDGEATMKLPHQTILASGSGCRRAAGSFAGLQVHKPIRRGRFGWSWDSPLVRAIDILARLIAQSLSERFGQQFIVENGPGAAVAISPLRPSCCAPPDGYTLLAVGSNNMINATLYKSSISISSAISPWSRVFTAWASGHGGKSFISGQDASRTHRLC